MAAVATEDGGRGAGDDNEVEIPTGGRAIVVGQGGGDAIAVDGDNIDPSPLLRGNTVL